MFFCPNYLMEETFRDKVSQLSKSEAITYQVVCGHGDGVSVVQTATRRGIAEFSAKRHLDKMVSLDMVYVEEMDDIKYYFPKY